jgi:acyl dehydratase
MVDAILSNERHAVAAGYSGFVTAFDERSGEHAIWRAMLTCEEEMGGCDTFQAIDVSSDDSLAIAYCVNGNYQQTPGTGISRGVDEAAEEAMGIAENAIIESRPLEIDPEYAQRVGLPGNILHGLYTMAQVARANVNAAGGDPRRLRRLSVQFRGLGVPEEEITVSGSVKEERDGQVLIAAEAKQGGKRIIRNAEAELTV